MADHTFFKPVSAALVQEKILNQVEGLAGKVGKLRSFRDTTAASAAHSILLDCSSKIKIALRTHNSSPEKNSSNDEHPPTNSPSF